MDNIKRYRNEWKFYCKDSDIVLLESRISKIMNLDKNISDVDLNSYTVHSLYFDDYQNNCAKRKEAGDFQRYKWRIRYYKNNNSFLRLERKEKINGMSYKSVCEITTDEYYKIISKNISDLLWNTDKKLLKNFCYDILMHCFTPKIIVNYERTAYNDAALNIRVSIDKNLFASSDTDNFLNDSYMRYPIIENNNKILEVKFYECLPEYIKNLISSDNIIQTSFSKYYFGRKKVEELTI